MSERCYRGEGCQGREQGALGSRPGARRYPLMCPAGSAVSLTARPGDPRMWPCTSQEEWRLFTGPEDPVPGRDVG